MASIKKIASMYFDECYDGISWIALWKEGRSWKAETFYSVDYNEKNGSAVTADAEELERMEEILKLDQDAVLLNGYYCNLGGEDMTVQSLANALRWQYEECEGSYLYSCVESSKAAAAGEKKHLTEKELLEAIQCCMDNRKTCNECPNLKPGTVRKYGIGDCLCDKHTETVRVLQQLIRKNESLRRILKNVDNPEPDGDTR